MSCFKDIKIFVRLLDFLLFVFHVCVLFVRVYVMAVILRVGRSGN